MFDALSGIWDSAQATAGDLLKRKLEQSLGLDEPPHSGSLGNNDADYGIEESYGRAYARGSASQLTFGGLSPALLAGGAAVLAIALILALKR
jgi:hypothetical protein